MSFYKNDKDLISAALAPRKPIARLPAATTTLGSVARTYNRIGGLVDTLGAATGIDTLAALAVWMVESGGRAFTKGTPVIRFENHVYWDRWGADHAAIYDQHFVFGGHGATGKRWEGHKWRKDAKGAWAAFHGTQDSEYAVYRFAKTLSGREPAAQSASWGGTQVMGFNHGLLGYASACDLVDAYLDDERWQVLGFFDFCKSSGLIAAIKAQDWVAFGNGYNGPGGGATYGPKLQAIHALGDTFDALRH
jgi:hypothetical protein